METIDSKKALELLHEVATSKGDFVYLDHYNACRNFELVTKEPACIVGHVLGKLGLTDEQCGNGTVVTTVRNLEGIASFTVAAVAALAAAQGVQDSGGTWGEAVNAAERVTETLRYFDPTTDDRTAQFTTYNRNHSTKENGVTN